VIAPARRKRPPQSGGHVRFFPATLAHILAIRPKPVPSFVVVRSPLGGRVEVRTGSAEHAVCQLSRWPGCPAARALPLLLAAHVKIRAEAYVALDLIPEFQALILSSPEAWLHIQLLENPQDRPEITRAQHIARVVIASEAAAAAVAEGGQ
jgi:hypothetical protein